ncbi:MAG: heme exporter protein CcmB [Proteobacteria bacterium]|nr:heme exporter protein CcmB [Pseudomonadota bacterium]
MTPAQNDLGTLGVLTAVVRRDLLLALRRKSEVMTALFFFVIVVSLFPLGIGPEMTLLRIIAPGVLWVAALLAAMLSLNRLFGLPLVLIAPVLGLQYDLDGRALTVLMASLLIGTPLLSLIGAIGAALTLGVRGGGVLLSLLTLPLYIPALIFGAGAVEADISGLGAAGHLSLLAALLALACFFAPWATTAALRIALE